MDTDESQDQRPDEGYCAVLPQSLEGVAKSNEAMGKETAGSNIDLNHSSDEVNGFIPNFVNNAMETEYSGEGNGRTTTEIVGGVLSEHDNGMRNVDMFPTAASYRSMTTVCAMWICFQLYVVTLLRIYIFMLILKSSHDEQLSLFFIIRKTPYAWKFNHFSPNVSAMNLSNAMNTEEFNASAIFNISTMIRNQQQQQQQKHGHGLGTNIANYMSLFDNENVTPSETNDEQSFALNFGNTADQGKSSERFFDF
ncbi:unnamed protein product [Gongylonema pulchrum]|uniref:Uncharacterized protein n=1 Tax=Gongylonema pulchrum TaxID=637853 RepID=A0A183DW03_9BILA|nr:unnamed protein product [Gongylonema pulchrum]